MITHLEPDILEYKIKQTLGNITTNKAHGGDGILVELFQNLKDNAVKMLHSKYQQIWKTQQWPQDWKRSVFIPIPNKSNAKNVQGMCAQSCPTLCDLMDCSQPGSSVHGFFQARILEWVVISFYRESCQSRDESMSLASPALAGSFFTC